MISKIEIAGVHYEVDADIKKYVRKKIGRLDLYMPKHARASAHAEVKLKQAKSKDKKQSTCEVVMRMPHATLTVHESTVNMFAAVDIVEAKLKNQLKKYKEKNTQNSRSREVVRRFLGKVRVRRKTAE